MLFVFLIITIVIGVALLLYFLLRKNTDKDTQKSKSKTKKMELKKYQPKLMDQRKQLVQFTKKDLERQVNQLEKRLLQGTKRQLASLEKKLKSAKTESEKQEIKSEIDTLPKIPNLTTDEELDKEFDKMMENIKEDPDGIPQLPEGQRLKDRLLTKEETEQKTKKMTEKEWDKQLKFFQDYMALLNHATEINFLESIANEDYEDEEEKEEKISIYHALVLLSGEFMKIVIFYASILRVPELNMKYLSSEDDEEDDDEKMEIFTDLYLGAWLLNKMWKMALKAMQTYLVENGAAPNVTEDMLKKLKEEGLTTLQEMMKKIEAQKEQAK
tara:strand:+ start:242 stop:1222 length:981 start_codon:yes stop_codon:yes gene_type:complete